MNFRAQAEGMRAYLAGETLHPYSIFPLDPNRDEGAFFAWLKGFNHCKRIIEEKTAVDRCQKCGSFDRVINLKNGEHKNGCPEMHKTRCNKCGVFVRSGHVCASRKRDQAGRFV